MAAAAVLYGIVYFVALAGLVWCFAGMLAAGPP